MKHHIVLMVLCGLLGSFPPTVVSGQIAYVGFEDSTWEADTSCCSWLYDPWNDNVFRVPTEGEPSNLAVWISPSTPNEGERSLGVRLMNDDGCSTKQRVEFEISNDNYFTQTLEMSRYYGFAIYIHPQSDDIVKPTIFMQAWQRHDTTFARYPPLSLEFIEGPHYRWRVKVSTGSPFPRSAPGEQSVVYTSPAGLEKGRWHEFVVWFKPSVIHQGAVKVWLNGSAKVSQTHQRNFGYPVRSRRPGIITDDFQVRFGAYRGRSCGPPTPRGNTILFFDQIKFGRSYSEVDP